MRRFLLFMLLCMPGVWGDAPKPRLYVFLPSPMRPHAMQSRLIKAYPKWDITVFGRYKEFERQINNAPPDAILTLPVVADQFKTFQIKLKGARSGKADETCVLLSVNQAISPLATLNNPIGVVDLLGRRKMETFLSQKLGVEKVRVRTVTKLEDLLSLLQFQDVDAIFVPKSIVEYYRERSRLNLIVNDLSSASIGLPIVAFKAATVGEAESGIDNLINLDEKLKELLGVDLWQRP